jgi:hypothetical protein
MSISAVSSGSVAATTTTHATHTAPAQQQQQSKAVQKAPAADTVTISKQAQQLASDGDTQAKEIRESGAEKASEKARGKA